MPIKELAYSAQLCLGDSTGDSFRRSHVYELLAASFGFKSYAAFTTRAVFLTHDYACAPPTQHTSALRERCITLGYRPATAEAVSSGLPNFLMEQHLGFIEFAELLNELRGEVSYPDEESLDRADNTLNDQFELSKIDFDSPILLEGLEAAATKGNALAHYALALICSSDEDDREQISPYWHTQAQQGRALTDVQRDWADAWTSQQTAAEKHLFHLREAARLGNVWALFDLAEQFGDPAFFDAAADSADVDPVRAAEIAEELGRAKDARHWLTVAAEAGNTYAMRVLIKEYDHENLRRCWTWLHLARLVGIDLTLDDYRAINEDGSDYDDDVGGPAYVGGVGGVQLDPLSTEQNVEALQVAHKLFEKIRRND